MKVVCEGCQAKYQVPDERVAGRKLRIKCRRCGNGIIVRGDQLAVSSPPPAPEGDEWHVSLDDVEHGPMDHAQLLTWLGMRGDRWDAYVWCDGMDDWLPARDVTALSESAGGALPSSEDDSPTQMVQSGFVVNQAAAAPSSGVRASQTNDPFGDSAYPPVASDRPTPAAIDPVASYPSAPPVARSAPTPSPRVSSEQALTGTRNEESVLFSASSLRSVAASSTANLAMGADPVKARKGIATGEGSGLIDIAALASLSANSETESKPIEAAVPQGDMGHTPMVATVQNLAQKEESSSVLPVAIFAGALVVAAGVFMGIVMTQKPKTAATAGESVAVPTVAAAAAVAPQAAAAPAVAATPAPPVEEPVKAAGEAADAPGDEPADEVAKADGAEAASAKANTPAAPARKKPKAKRAARKPGALAKAAPKKKQASAGIDDLLAPKKAAPEPKEEPKEEPKGEARSGPSVDDILGGKEPEAKDKSIDDLLSGATGPGATRLASSPSRDAVIAAMKGVSSAVRRCAKQAGVTGIAKAAITVKGDTGRVSAVDVSGVNPPVSDCIATAVRKARFPKFSKPTFSLKYPFKLK